MDEINNKHQTCFLVMTVVGVSKQENYLCRHFSNVTVTNTHAQSKQTSQIIIFNF